MVSTFSLLPLAKENESLNHFPLTGFEKGAFSDALGTRQSQYVVKLTTGGKNPGNSRYEP